MALMNPARSEFDGAPTGEALPNEAGATGPSRRPGPTKFLYASGDRPLEGYTIRRGIGRGGFGEVYFAESDAGKEVAMKLIRRNLDVELRGVRHCLNIKHPNLIALYDIRADEAGDEWVIMEYVSGAGAGANSLEEVIEQHPNGMPEEDVNRWMRGIGAGVAHLHDNGIVHRDLKPGNIFLDGDAVKIGDYGLSKFISCSRRSGQTESVGTVHYMAPEIANGRYGREIDTYALGIILYEMLTGHVPFEGESVGEVLMKHLTAEPDLERVGEPYREIIRRALAKDPEVRIRTVGELLSMLPGMSAMVDDSSLAAPPLDAARAAAPPNHAAAPRRSTQPAQEPIYQSVSEGWSYFWDRWNASRINPALKAVIIVAVGVGMVASGVAWIPALISLAVLYCVYYVIWSIFLEPDTPSTHSVEYEPHQLAARQQAKRAQEAGQRENRHNLAAERRRRRLTWREAARKQLVQKPTRAKLTELTGSMLMAAMLCVGGSVLATWAMAPVTKGDNLSVGLWLSVVTTLGSWAVLVTNKTTEGKYDDQAPMRGMLLALGAGVGLVAAMLSLGLPVVLPYESDFGPEISDTFAGSFDDGYKPRSQGIPIAISAVYFGLLFLMLRWWRQAEWVRGKRLSVMSVVGCVFFAWLLHIFWWFPQPTGIAVAAIVSVATQLSSPWLAPSKREQMARGEVTA